MTKYHQLFLFAHNIGSAFPQYLRHCKTRITSSWTVQDSVGEDLSEHRVSADGEHTENQKDAKSHRGACTAVETSNGTCTTVQTDVTCSVIHAFPGNPFNASTAEACCALCMGAKAAGCVAWTLEPAQGNCYLKANCNALKKKVGATSGFLPAAMACDGVIRPMADGREGALMPPVSYNHHASFLHELPGGAGMGMVWFAGPKIEQCYNCSVYFSRLPIGSTRWQMPKLISRRNDWGAENPNLFSDPATGYLYAHHASSPPSDCKGDPTGMGKGCCGGLPGGCQAFSNIWRVVSKDGRGDTWEMPEDFFDVNSSITRNRPVQLSTGKWLFPMFHACGSFAGKDGCDWPNASANIDHSGILHSPSSDAGMLEWPETPVVGSGCRVHPSIVDLGEGHLKTFFRSRDKTWIYVMDSFDNGQSWSAPQKTKIPNNNASLQANVLKHSNYTNGTHTPIVLVFDNTHGKVDKKGDVDVGNRYPLSIALSYDGGLSFPFVRDLETAHEEFSYPSVVQAEDGRIHASNTYARETVKHHIVTEDWIRVGGTVGLFKGGAI